MPSPTRAAFESDARYQARLTAWRLDKVEERLRDAAVSPSATTESAAKPPARNQEDDALEVARLAAMLASGIWTTATISPVMPHLAFREIVKDARQILAEARRQVREQA